MARQSTRPPRATPAAPTLPERLCPEHAVLMEPVGELAAVPYYYCPTKGAIRAWRLIFKQGDAAR